MFSLTGKCHDLHDLSPKELLCFCCCWVCWSGLSFIFSRRWTPSCCLEHLGMEASFVANRWHGKDQAWPSHCVGSKRLTMLDPIISCNGTNVFVHQSETELWWSCISPGLIVDKEGFGQPSILSSCSIYLLSKSWGDTPRGQPLPTEVTEWWTGPLVGNLLWHTQKEGLALADLPTFRTVLLNPHCPWSPAHDGKYLGDYIDYIYIYIDYIIHWIMGLPRIIERRNWNWNALNLRDPDG